MKSLFSGGEGGIRTRDDLGATVSCRFQIAEDAKFPTDAVNHCTLLHAADFTKLARSLERWCSAHS
jgi:hypothetical protein